MTGIADAGSQSAAKSHTLRGIPALQLPLGGSQHGRATDGGAAPVAAGMRLIQLLPVNDTSVNMMWWDSYPYSSLSVSATPGVYTRTAAAGSTLRSVSWSSAQCSTSSLLRWSAS